MNAGSNVQDTPPCLCANAFASRLRDIVALRARFSVNRIPLRKLEFHEAFRDVKINSDHAHSFSYIFDDLIMVAFRLTFSWTHSSGYWGVPAKAVAFSHCSTSLNSMAISEQGKQMMIHGRMVPRREYGLPNPVPLDVIARPARSRDPGEPFFA